MKAPAVKKPKPPEFHTHRFEKGNRSLVGYARVSTLGQNLASQLDALEAAGAHLVISEKVSSVGSRPGWQRACDLLRPGDTLIVTRLDRIGRQLREIINSVQDLREQGIHVRALQQGLDTGSAAGTIILAVWAALAETERTTLRERTREGLAASQARGRKGGRPTVVNDAKRALVAHLNGQGFAPSEIATQLRIGETTVRRVIATLRREEPRQLRLLQESAPAAALELAAEQKAPAKPKKPKKPKKPARGKRSPMDRAVARQVARGLTQ